MAAIGVGLWLAVPPQALAVEPGVIVGPDDPAGVEYAIPLDSARRDAAGGGSSGSRTGNVSPSWPLFGVGITPSRLTGDSSRLGNPATRSDGLANRVGAVGGASATLWTVGIPAAVLLIGLMLGLALRRGSGDRG